MRPTRRLAELIESKIGTGYRTHPSELQVLNNYADDKELLDKLGEIKRHNKQRLADYIKAHNGIEVNMDSIFDVQVKRLHEYKRQMLNILHHQPVPQAEGPNRIWISFRAPLSSAPRPHRATQ